MFSQVNNQQTNLQPTITPTQPTITPTQTNQTQTDLRNEKLDEAKRKIENLKKEMMKNIDTALARGELITEIETKPKLLGPDDFKKNDSRSYTCTIL